ncbi:DUF3810 domain-containing protein [Tenuibacillus multivorans]|uniref:DUF3810 domain-containing protein n=1 Tax=Tenuibacillus multivorans TaxID=237069 RepID=UPI0011BF5A6E|nr:DUF3810 domain-containing protein [Tenuibacillus multivorans]
MAANQNPVPFSIAVLIGSLIWFVILAILLHIGRKLLNKITLQWLIAASGIVVLGYSFYFFWQFFIEIF